MTKDTSFYSLKIAKRKQETPEAVTLSFEIPEELKKTFTYKAGQYLTIKAQVNGSEERRSYSMSTAPGDKHPGITIKKVKGGKMSEFLCDSVSEGQTVEVMPPDGRFVVEPDAERARTYYFFGAGSGITPLMSQIRTILEHEPLSVVHLYYGNKSTETIIFYSELEALVQRYTDQLTVDHTLTQINKGGFLSGLFGKKKDPGWTGETGRISGEKISSFLEKYPKRTSDVAYHICGPGEMIEHVKDVLLKKGVERDDIHAEYFTTPEDQKAHGVTFKDAEHSKAVVTLRGERIEVEVHDKTILETLEDAGYDPPFSCTSGACATCMAKVLKGSARMEMCFALTPQEIEDGYILTCQSHPTTDEIEITYDV